MPAAALDPSFPAPPSVDPRRPVLWWLGQATFAVRVGRTLLLIDPYLSDTLAEKYRGTAFPHTRMVPPPVDPAVITGLDAVLCTHSHTDHMDPGTIAAVQQHNDPVFVVPRAERDKAVERGVPPARLVGVGAGESVTVAGIEVHAVPAAHEQLTADARGDLLHLGYVLDLAGVRVYHSGDCVPYPGQVDLLRGLGVQVALLPVNGRDERRSGNGIPGNFHWYEAVGLCRAAGIADLICHHWGLFDFNTVDPVDLSRDLSADAADLSWTVPAIGAAYELSPTGGVRAVP